MTAAMLAFLVGLLMLEVTPRRGGSRCSLDLWPRRERNRVAIPKKGRPSKTRQAIQSTGWFRKLIKWRTGAEGRISCLKRDFGWARTRVDGIDGARTWCGWGVLNHNLVKLATTT